jgi:tetratricopeptide (TPR) repeat protein
MMKNEMPMTNARNSFPVPAFLRRGLWLFLCGASLLPGVLCAEKPAKSLEEQERAALLSARAYFDDHQYNLAESSLSHFLATYTNSPSRPYAILYLALSRLEQSNYDGAIQQLMTNAAPQSGPLAGEYPFWIATARLDKGEYLQAAEGFAGLVRNFTNSDRRLEAAYFQAEAYSKLENWPQVVDLLQKPDSAFRKLAAEAGKNAIVTRGHLLLGEALFEQGKYAGGEKEVDGIDPSGLGAEWQWRRQYLLCRLELAGGRAGQALQNSSNLLDGASGPRHQAASWFLRGEILETLGRTNEALQSYTNNLAANLPPEDQRQALLKTVELKVALNQNQDAVQLLEGYVTLRTNGAALDLARLSLGELHLKIFYSPALEQKTNDSAVAVTNYLQQALANFDRVISNFPASTLVAKARLDRGWCYWEETNIVGARTNLAGARADFQAAADSLSSSPAQAVARFKLADVEFYQHDYGNAVSNYNRLLHDYANVESVTNGGLFDQALYQIVEASLAVGDQNGAEAALRKILDWYPSSLFGDRGQLLLGESKRYDYAMARQVFNDLLNRSPNTRLLPEVQYQIARTYEQEGNWAQALREYDRWVSRHATNAPLLLPRVEYARALVYGKAGMETNALALFTNFVAAYPTNSLAPWAQNWVADYYFNQGDNQKAERNYELLYQAFPNAGDLPYQARLLAGRAALARQGTLEARQYFSDLVAMTNAPANLVAQGWFALSDTIWQQFQDNPTNVTYFNEAIKAISNLTNGVATNAVAIQAYGRLGDYYMQWGDMQWEQKHDPKVYTDAVQMYQIITNFPPANVDVATRSQAEVALGRVAERQGQTDQALAHYCKVLYELDPDHFDPFWVEQAGVAAAQIYERQQQWDKAVKVRQRVLQAVPSLRAALQKTIMADQGEADRAKN